LTFRDPVLDAAVAHHDGYKLLRRVRRRNGGTSFPYIVVAERHADGRRCHLHLLLPTCIAAEVEDCWRQGFIDVQRLVGKPAQRAAAMYLTKSFEDTAASVHRYRCGHGFQPVVVRAVAPTEEAAKQWAVRCMGGLVPDSEWSSGDYPCWPRPPVRLYTWDA
jgi:CheY-like chemotaxis protein